MRTFIVSLAVIAGLMSVAAAKAQTAEVKSLSEAELTGHVLDIINIQRVQHGCAPLQMDSRLVEAAERQSQAMATQHFAGHIGPDGSTAETRVEATGYRFTAVAENIQVNVYDPVMVVQTSLNAAKHRDNLLNCAYSQTGIAVVLQDDGMPVPGVPADYKYYWTQILATPTVIDRANSTQAALDMINAERAKQGCSPLQIDAKLSAAAERESRDMVTKHFFSHTEPDGTTPGSRVKDAGYIYQMIGENIEVNDASPEDAVTAWMNSPGHRANILTCAFKETGIAVVDQPDDVSVEGVPAAYKSYWTQVFAMPFSSGR